MSTPITQFTYNTNKKQANISGGSGGVLTGAKVVIKRIKNHAQV